MKKKVSTGKSTGSAKPKRETISVKFTLLQNGLDFITEALTKLGKKHSEHTLKYATLHLSAGIELILKERLRREHWTLIFDKPDLATKVSYDSGNFTSVSFASCIKRLVDICGVAITSKSQNTLKLFRDKRNKIEHFGITDSPEALTASAAYVLNFLVDFINSEFPPDQLTQDNKEEISSIQIQLGEFQKFVTKRWKVIQGKIDTMTQPVVECAGCGQKAAVIEAGVECLFCGRKVSGEEGAQDYAMEFLGGRASYEFGDPTLECPSCEHNSLLDLCNQSSEQFLCFNCGERFGNDQIDFCLKCGRPFQMDGEQSVCDACYSEAVASDNT